ncbi:MAG: hypothetical protein IPM27_06415 [Nitrosomonadales bacterium]|nr:hypothetical protein [Nitrosomonadales bacterium]
MDETAYRQKFAEVVQRPCVFEKALLSRCIPCAQERRIQIAEREAIACRDAASHARCRAAHGQLRHAFSFALGTAHDDTVLPHAQELRVQCGGLTGLRQALDGDAAAGVDELTVMALRRWNDWDGVPWSEVVHAAAQCYQGRHT